MAENNIHVRADLNPDVIDNADQDVQDPLLLLRTTMMGSYRYLQRHLEQRKRH
jgi:hypothetical protein